MIKYVENINISVNMALSMKVSVIITSYNDPRIRSTLLSLNEQSYPPDEIFVADGGSKIDIESICLKFSVKFEMIPGNIPQTRSAVINKATGDILVFIDTDEIAPKQWLENLVNPIIKGEADFTGGPTKHLPTSSQTVLYVNLLEDEMYKGLVQKDIRYLPMGNSAWSRKIFTKIGTFNSNLPGSEDYDINIRAMNAGFIGKFIPEAWVYHDHSDIDTIFKLIRKRYKYLRTTAKVYRMQSMFKSRLSMRNKSVVRHPFYVIEEFLKPIALIDSMIRN